MRATIREAVKSEPTWTAVISKAEFGRRIGLSKGRIYQLVAEGLPFSADRRIDFAKAMRWVDRNLDQHRRVARKPGAFPVAVKPSETEPQSVSGKCSFGNRNSKKASGE